MLLTSRKTKQKILAEFLPICVFEGWSDQALIMAMSNCGIDRKFLPLIFENGVVDLARFYIEEQNHKTAEIVGDLSEKKIRDKIHLLLYARFEVEEKNKIVLQRLKTFRLHGLKAFYEIADFMWKNIGDPSTDFNFYTKRLTLAKIIFRSLRFFLKHDLAETKNFIDLEIERVMKFERHKKQVKNFFGEVFLNETGQIKSPKEIIKNLPFFRLVK
ncbi:MAG: hypothetical protein A2887_03850 [Alphaproteobacteria bacterium RIFCSPLOWO2_01_FULL_40_26]|nr:MAG: hypothetical protein A3D15_05005 [Alphaproteobacteria bacterium RIFCSPHIGHO2_02_FULL_40_34]OFW95331.1 MAG: hypothetical protein A2887_03850 [Alphaproteobacteria bacterium RIFCSPLOWO2_01_FULL_40_26]OFX09234.1 MAG: hypothetical protein A3H30_06555 [Alphaproteobacteria bacterium RIFCSPLOWO2_02_FULL_40_19]OFX11589.1 MAG: hypothetical protein A3G22_05160 [Alphaproteobacteria bacterium RIFCSPLOWO2_12_FULL_40_11]